MQGMIPLSDRWDVKRVFLLSLVNFCKHCYCLQSIGEGIVQKIDDYLPSNEAEVRVQMLCPST